MGSSTYIVTFKKDTPQDVIDKQIADVEASGATVKHRYNSAIKGFSVEVPDDVINACSLSSPHIDGIEADGEVTTLGQKFIK
ncbi:hypothetical protein BDB01DRAFT_798723 [Pilobolus umbonatus]|nr:hypothetical protein BDB01DRAFT_798723 [Pilobolus umbonatus]